MTSRSDELGNAFGEQAMPGEFTDVEKLPQTPQQMLDYKSSLYGPSYLDTLLEQHGVLPLPQSGPMQPSLPPPTLGKPEPDTWDGNLYTAMNELSHLIAKARR